MVIDSCVSETNLWYSGKGALSWTLLRPRSEKFFGLKLLRDLSLDFSFFLFPFSFFLFPFPFSLFPFLFSLFPFPFSLFPFPFSYFLISFIPFP